MKRTRPQLPLEEIPGQKFGSLADAQRSARPALAGDLAQTIRSLIEKGLLEIRDGKIIPGSSSPA